MATWGGTPSGRRGSPGDLSLEKNVKFTERVSGAVRIESYNAFNRVNLNGPSTDLTSNNFGKVTSAATGRLYTVSMRLRF